MLKSTAARGPPPFFPFFSSPLFLPPSSSPLCLFFPSFFYFRFSSWSSLELLSRKPRESTRAYHHGPIKSITRTCLIRVTMIRVTLFGSISLSVRVTEIRRKRVGVFLLDTNSQREKENRQPRVGVSPPTFFRASMLKTELAALVN